MNPFWSTESSESKIHFAGIIATVIGGFTRNLLHLYAPLATPGRCKKVHRCNFSNCRETWGFSSRLRPEFAEFKRRFLPSALDRHTPNRTTDCLTDLSLRIAKKYKLKIISAGLRKHKTALKMGDWYLSLRRKLPVSVLQITRYLSKLQQCTRQHVLVFPSLNLI